MILRFSEITMTTPSLYSWFHILSIFSLFVFSILLILNIHKTNDKLLIVFAVIIVLGEIYKQYDYYMHGDWGINHIKQYQWYVFPFQFCGTPLYLLPLALISKNEKRKTTLYTYLATYGLFAGLIVMFVPTNVFRDRLGINIQTMVHHIIMVLTGIYLWHKNMVGKKDSFIKSTYLFITLTVIAIILNLTLHNISGEVINLFYLNPKLETTLPVFNIIQKKSYILFLLSYILTFSLMAVITFIISNKIFKKNKELDLV